MSGLPGAARYPLWTVYLDYAFVSGHVTLAVVDSLPATNVSVLIGHDPAGAQVVPNPIVSAVPTLVNNTLELEQDHPKLFPTCAVIRNKKNFSKNPLNRELQSHICSC